MMEIIGSIAITLLVVSISIMALTWSKEDYKAFFKAKTKDDEEF